MITIEISVDHNKVENIKKKEKDATNLEKKKLIKILDNEKKVIQKEIENHKKDELYSRVLRLVVIFLPLLILIYFFYKYLDYIYTILGSLFYGIALGSYIIKNKKIH